jgi:DNA polymerase-3 subunit epsilon
VNIKEYLTLDRPLVILDTETHGLVPPEQARIVELGYRVIYHDDREDKVFESLIDPGVPISPDATAKHTITNEAVKDAPSFRNIVKQVVMDFTGCDFCGYNVRFDVRVISGEVARNGIMWTIIGARLIDPLRLWQLGAPRSLTDAVREFCGREPNDAHRALADAQDAYNVLCGQFKRWGDDVIPRDIGKLHDISFGDNVDIEGKFRWKGLDVVCTFGKHNGVSLVKIAQTDRKYLTWLCDADFSADVKRIASDALVGIFPAKS